MAELSVQQKNLIKQYKNANPKLKNLTDKQILSIMLKKGAITLTEAQKKSIFTNNNQAQSTSGGLEKGKRKQTITLKSGRKIEIKGDVVKYYAADGTEINKAYFEKQEGQISIKASGRYSVTKAGKTSYYAANGTEIKENYFKQVESSDVQVKSADGKSYNVNKALEGRLNNVSANLKKAEESNGFIGKSWSRVKNTLDFGDSSNKVRELIETEKKLLAQFNSNEQTRPKVFQKLTGVEYTQENLEKFLKGEIKLKSEQALAGYNEGQEMAVDIAGDIISGIAAVGIYTAAVAAAPFSGGASILVGVAAAGASGALIKSGIKSLDAVTGGREYTADNFKKDLATGAFSGVLAPITGGMGGAVGKTIATRFGIQAVKQVGKEVAEEAVTQTTKGFVKTALTNPYGYEYIGGNAFKRRLAYSAEMVTDGTLGGFIDGAFRTAYDGGSLKEIGESALMGGVSGGAGAWFLGSVIKGLGKGAQKLFGKNDVNLVEYRTEDGRTVVRIDENGNEIPASATDAEIHIPKGRFKAPDASFLETDDAFRNIVKKRADDIVELDKIKDVDEFLEKSFSMIKEEMGLADSPIKFEITNGDNQYDLVTNTISINPNWANGDRAELFGAIAHELNHFLQWKEVILNFDRDSDYWLKVVNTLQKTDAGSANIDYIIKKYPDNIELQEFFNKAKSYEGNWQNYIDPADPKTGKVDVASERYKRYKEQPVEAEAMRRGDIVVEEYRKVISGKKVAEYSTPAKISTNGIKEFIANNPELKNNKWVQENIESLLDVCNDANNYGAPLLNLKEKILHPLLKQHRLEILSTFLSDPKLYNDKQLQQNFIHLLRTYNAKTSKNMVESLKWYATLQDAEIRYSRKGMNQANNLKEGYAYYLLRNNSLSLENKNLIYEYIYKNNSPELNKNAPKLKDLCCNISNDDDINFILSHFDELANMPFFNFIFTRHIGIEGANTKFSMLKYFKSKNEDLQNQNILSYIQYATQDNMNFIKEYYNNPDWKDYLADIIPAIKDYNSDFAKELINDAKFPKESIARLLNVTYKHNIDFVRNELYKNPNVPRCEIANIANATAKHQEKFCLELISNKDFPIDQVADFINSTHEIRILNVAKKLHADPNISKKDLVEIVKNSNVLNIDAKIDIYETLSKSNEFSKEQISKILIAINIDGSNKDSIIKLCKNYTKMGITIDNKIAGILAKTNKDNFALAEKLCTDTKLNFPKDKIADIILNVNANNLKLAERLCIDKKLNFPKDKIADIILNVNANNLKLAERLCIDKKLNFPKEYIPQLLRLDCVELILQRLDNPQFVKDVVDICKSEGSIPSLFVQGYNLIGKESLTELTKTEKREFIEVLLAQKRIITNGIDSIVKEKIPLIPTSTNEYILVMKKLANSLNISMEPVAPAQVAKFNHVIDDFSYYLKSANLSSLEDINLTMPHSEFISRVENIIKHLPKEEQAKIQDFYGFKIIDGKLSGYPNLTAKDLNLAEITNVQTIAVVNKLQKLIDDYVNNNFVTVKDNPLLNQQLKEISRILPEIFNQIDGSKTSVNMIKSLQKIVKNSAFEKLSESDKRIIMLATLLHNTDKISGSVKESAFDAYFIAKKYNMTDDEARKVYSIIEASDFVEIFMNTQKRPTEINIRGAIIGQEREDKFDLMAFKLKEGNFYELAQMLYSSKYPEGFTRYFDKILSDRIHQMKANDFILPQTSIETYLSHAQQKTITRDSNSYSVQVVESKDIKDFYAIIHTPEAGYATGGSRGANFANFDSFAVLNDDKVICTSYVGNDMAGLVKEFHNGFIFDVQNDKQYVGYGTDIFSLAKNIPNMIVEYFRDRGFQANRGRGQKFGHRTMISNVLKSLLYGKDYYNMSINLDSKITIIRQKYEVHINNISLKRKDYIRQKFGTDNITYEQFKSLRQDEQFVEIENKIKALEKQQAEEIQNIPGYADIEEMDKLYIKRLDELKAKLGNRTMTLENIEEFDPEFAKAYKEFLQRNGSEHPGDAYLLRSGWHNEVLVSNPKISAIFTDDIDKIPEEYLIKAQEENLPIVIIKS